MAEEDPFASIMELCEPTSSQEFPLRPVTLDTWDASSDEELSSPAPAASEATDHHLSPPRVRASEDEPVEKRVRVEQPEAEIEVIEIEDSDSDESVEIVGEKRSDTNLDGRISEELLQLKRMLKGKEKVQEKRGLMELLDDLKAIIVEEKKDEGGDADILKTAVKKGMKLPPVHWWPPQGF